MEIREMVEALDRVRLPGMISAAERLAMLEAAVAVTRYGYFGRDDLAMALRWVSTGELPMPDIAPQPEQPDDEVASDPVMEDRVGLEAVGVEEVVPEPRVIDGDDSSQGPTAEEVKAAREQIPEGAFDAIDSEGCPF